MSEAPADVGSGARLADALQRRLTRATVLANATGALVTFFAVGFLGPIATPDALSLGVSIRNFVAAVIYVGVALVIGIRVGNQRAWKIREWLRSGRPPGD